MSKEARHRIQLNSKRMIDGMTVVHEIFRHHEGKVRDVEQRIEGGVQSIYFTADAELDLDFLRPWILPPK